MAAVCLLGGRTVLDDHDRKKNLSGQMKLF